MDVVGWKFLYGGEGPSEEFATRQQAREALCEKFSLHPSVADKYVWPVILPNYAERDPA